MGPYVAVRETPKPYGAGQETSGPHVAMEGTPRPHVVVRRRVAPVVSCEARKGCRGHTRLCGGGRHRRGRAGWRGGRTCREGVDDSRGHKVEIEEHVELSERGSGRRRGKGEMQLIENDVTRDEDSV
jgi:hypothetical protein